MIHLSGAIRLLLLGGDIMADIIKELAAAVAAASSKKEDKPPRPPAYKFFRAVAFCDFPRQMDVFRWLINDDFYRVIYILHDRDIYDADDKNADGKILHSLPDTDEKQEFQVGDKKPPHYHMIIEIPKKCTEGTMSDRFAAYLHFDGLSDRYASARYLTHETYKARHKAQYPRENVCGDLSLYADCMGEDVDVCATAKRWMDYRQQAQSKGASPDNVNAEAAKLAIIAGDSALVSSVMSHSYFYSKFF